jgi:hypothetical protein
MLTPSPCLILLLFILDLSLQAWDGLPTCQGLSLSVQEGNPLVQTAIDHFEAGWALLSAKGLACGLLLMLRAFSQYILSVLGLLLTAVIYYVFSFLP